MKIVGGIIGFLCLLCILGTFWFIGSIAISAYSDPRSIGEQIGAIGGDIVNGFENSTNPQ